MTRNSTRYIFLQLIMSSRLKLCLKIHNAIFLNLMKICELLQLLFQRVSNLNLNNLKLAKQTSTIGRHTLKNRLCKMTK
jgi:hypothetical protein